MSDHREANVSELPSRRSFKKLRDCKTMDEAFESHDFFERIQASVPEHVKPARLLRTFITAAGRSPNLRQAKLTSFIGACLTLSQVGLEPNTPLGHAWLIPFKDSRESRKQGRDVYDVNLIFGYPGLLDLSFRSPQMRSVHADVVWPGDEFSFEYGSDAHLRHKPTGMPRQEGDRPIYAYMHAKLRDGQAFEVMPYSEVLKIRDAAQAYRFAKAAKENAENGGQRPPPAWTEAPWVKFEVQMARKTAFRSGSKWLPRSVELASAFALDEAGENKRMDFSTVMDAQTIDGKADYLGAAMDASSAPEETDTAEAGAAFTDRREEKPEEEKTRQTRKRREAPPPHPETLEAHEVPRETPRQETPPTAPRFEAILIDQFGDPIGEFTNAEHFATDLVALWENTDGNENVKQHNADAIEDAEKHPKAAEILKEGLRPIERKEEAAEPLTYVPVSPPMNGGRAAWSVYPQLIRDDLASVQPGDLSSWLDAQRPILTTAPISPKIIAVKIVTETLTHAGIAVPAWLTEGLPKPQEGSKRGDITWAEDMEAALAGLAVSHQGRREFDQLVNSTLSQTVMSRLSREDRPLFEKMDLLFKKRHGELPAAPGAAG